MKVHIKKRELADAEDLANALSNKNVKICYTF